jgi:hypothetical protein
MSYDFGRVGTTAAHADYLVERDGLEPEVSLAVLPTAQSETPAQRQIARAVGRPPGPRALGKTPHQ